MSCLSPETLTAYLGDGLPEAQRAAAEDHLSRCATCRRLLVQHHQQARLESAAQAQAPTPVPPELLETARAIGRRQDRPSASRWTAPLAAAAVLLVAVGLGQWRLDRAVSPAGSTPGGETFRSEGPSLSGNALVTASSPADGALVDSDGVTLRWQVASGNVLETTLTLVDGLGDMVWQGPVEGSSWVLQPQRLAASPPGTLYWFVTVRLDRRHHGGDGAAQPTSTVAGSYPEI